MLALLQSKALLAAGLGAMLPLAAANMAPDAMPSAAEPQPPAAVVRIAAGPFSYRPAGAFLDGGTPIEAPLAHIARQPALAIMRSQVSEAAYDRCARDGGCRPLAHRGTARPDFPVTGVSFDDANAYARWLSRRTGVTWRLPSDAEWRFAAGSRIQDAPAAAAETDPAKRWLARYEAEATRPSDPSPHAIGTFGSNENGLLDVAGNVWEWTESCFVRQRLDGSGEAISNCGVRVLEGAHRAYASTFIRDARAGGCSAGSPPDNLGFRLVREQPQPWLARLLEPLRRIAG